MILDMRIKKLLENHYYVRARNPYKCWKVLDLYDGCLPSGYKFSSKPKPKPLVWFKPPRIGYKAKK